MKNKDSRVSVTQKYCTTNRRIQ